MALKNNICVECEKLRLTLIEKDNEIEKLKLHIHKLTNYLLCKNNHDETQQFFYDSKCTIDSIKNTFIEPKFISSDLLSKSCNCLNTDTVWKSKSVQTDSDLSVPDGDITRTFEEYHVENHPDYVYDKNYEMYYSLSTGYYYDEKSGLMYEPQTGIYYKYNYDKKEYEIVPQLEGINENVYENEKTNSDISETVVDQVSNLNINDESAKIEGFENDVEIKNTLECGENVIDENHLTDDEAVTAALSDSENISLGCAKDWQPEEGSKLTITDMVKQVVEENCNMSDYIYDDSYQMYYSPSTGYFYDSVRNLLYDPSSCTYYFYDSTNQKYEFYYQAPPSTVENNHSASENNIKKNRLASRRKYWRKRLELSNQSPKSPKSDEGNNNSIDIDEEFSAPEDGEIFSSDEDQDIPTSVMKPPMKSETSIEEVFPPSIRAIVENSENLQIGSLILITCSGGIIGRDKTSAVYLPDICVSKNHASITFSNDFQKYSIEDLGSQNGTFINNKRLSEPKLKSEPHTLNHGDKLCLGSCKLLLHIHEGHDTCDCCEPGQVLAEIASHTEKAAVFISKEEKEKNRRDALRKLKKKYGLQGANFENKKMPLKTHCYEDKAEIRRQTVGSDNPYEKTEEASLDISMSERNKGYQMLKKMGWKEGQTLGKSDSGLVEPIPLRPWSGTAGLGSSDQPSFRAQSDDKKALKWVKAQERYFQLSLRRDVS